MKYITCKYHTYLRIWDIYLKYILVLFEVKCINTENKRFIRCNILHNR